MQKQGNGVDASQRKRCHWPKEKLGTVAFKLLCLKFWSKMVLDINFDSNDQKDDVLILKKDSLANSNDEDDADGHNDTLSKS